MIELLSEYRPDSNGEWDTDEVSRALAQIGSPRAVDALFNTFLEYQSADLIDALTKFKDYRILDTLITIATNDSDTSWRYDRKRPAAVKALGEYADERAIEPLVTLLGNQRQNLQQAAVHALIKIGEPTVDRLILALSDPNKARRANAATILGHIADLRALNPLRNSLQDSNERVRREARFAVSRLTSPSE